MSFLLCLRDTTTVSVYHSCIAVSMFYTYPVNECVNLLTSTFTFYYGRLIGFLVTMPHRSEGAPQQSTRSQRAPAANYSVLPNASRYGVCSGGERIQWTRNRLYRVVSAVSTSMEDVSCLTLYPAVTSILMAVFGSFCEEVFLTEDPQ